MAPTSEQAFLDQFHRKSGPAGIGDLLAWT
jgi:hypothetical protein